MVSILEYPSIDVIKYVGSDKLKCYHTGPDAHAQVILKEPHARIADNKSALPSDVIFQIAVHLHHVNVWESTCHLLVCSKSHHACRVDGS